MIKKMNIIIRENIRTILIQLIDWGIDLWCSEHWQGETMDRHTKVRAKPNQRHARRSICSA